MIDMDEDIIESAIESYNEYKADIAEAELVKAGKQKIQVKFEGNFCLSCCMDEYFIDLVYEMKDVDIETELKDFHQVGDKSFVAVYAKI